MKCWLCCYGFRNSMCVETKRRTDVKHWVTVYFRHNLYLTTGLMLLCGCSGPRWSELHSSVIAEQYSYNFNQHFHWPPFGGNSSDGKTMLLCHFTGVFTPPPPSPPSRECDISRKTCMLKNKGPCMDTLGRSLCTFCSWRRASKHSHVLLYQNTGSLLLLPLSRLLSAHPSLSSGSRPL